VGGIFLREELTMGLKQELRRRLDTHLLHLFQTKPLKKTPWAVGILVGPALPHLLGALGKEDAAINPVLPRRIRILISSFSTLQPIHTSFSQSFTFSHHLCENSS